MAAADAVREGCARVVCNGPEREIISIPRPALLTLLALIENQDETNQRRKWVEGDAPGDDEWLYVKKEAWE